MTITDLVEHRVEFLVNCYVKSRPPGDQPMSMASAVLLIRKVLPAYSISDGELAAIIADCAVRYGHVVDFDTAVALDTPEST